MRIMKCLVNTFNTHTLYKNAMRYVLGIPTMAERHKLAQVKAFLRVMADKKHPLHSKVGQRPPSRLKRGSEWMTEATGTIENSLSVESIRKSAVL